MIGSVSNSLVPAAALALLAGSVLAQEIGRPGSFPLHEEHGGATLLEIVNPGSREARMVGEFTPADIKEMCERIGWKFYSPSFPFHGAYEDRRTIQICRDREESRPLDQRRYAAEANCEERTLRMPSGYNVALKNARWETRSGRPVETEFTPGHLKMVERQFEMLCPGGTAASLSAAPR